jgi:hypothetical protein
MKALRSGPSFAMETVSGEEQNYASQIRESATMPFNREDTTNKRLAPLAILGAADTPLDEHIRVGGRACT